MYRFLIWLIGWFIYLRFRVTGDSRGAWWRQRMDPSPLKWAPDLWIHAVSVGESQLALALLKTWPSERVMKVLITTTTPSGFELLSQHLTSAQIRPLPLDHRSKYSQLLNAHPTPNLIVVETEIWPELYRFIQHRGAKIAIINARLSEKTTRWRRLPLLRNAMGRVSLICARSELDAERFKSMGANQPVVTGNIKYDYPRGHSPPDELVTWLNEDKLVIFASISADEVAKLVTSAQAALTHGFKVLWVPRHLDKLPDHLRLLTPLNPQLRSKMANQNSPSRTLVLDSYGELNGCYAYASLAVVGGSFIPRGGQNFIESIKVGTPVITGPFTHNFRVDVAEALAADALVQVQNETELRDRIVDLLASPDELCRLGERAASFAHAQQGALARTNEHLLNLEIITPKESS